MGLYIQPSLLDTVLGAQTCMKLVSKEGFGGSTYSLHYWKPILETSLLEVSIGRIWGLYSRHYWKPFWGQIYFKLV